MHNFILEYEGIDHCESRCHIRVLDDNDKPLTVICSEMPDNQGTSPTNWVEELVRKVTDKLRELGYSAARISSLIWIEHYPLGTGISRIGNTFAAVTLDPDGEIPHWNDLKKEDIVELTGYDLSNFENIP